MKYFFAAFLLTLTLCACNGPGAQEYKTANQAYAQGNYKTSFENYLYAAHMGVVPAQYAVGYQYYYGLGTKEDQTLAIMWLNYAAPHSMEATYALSQIQQSQSLQPWRIGLK